MAEMEKPEKKLRIDDQAMDALADNDATENMSDEINKRETHGERIALSEELVEIDDFKQYFIKVCIEANIHDRPATKFWNMICIAFFRGNLIKNLKDIECYKNMQRNFKSSENGIPIVKVNARFVDAEKKSIGN